jgi:hypothetical protein
MAQIKIGKVKHEFLLNFNALKRLKEYHDLKLQDVAIALGEMDYDIFPKILQAGLISGALMKKTDQTLYTLEFVEDALSTNSALFGQVIGIALDEMQPLLGALQSYAEKNGLATQ